MNSKNNREQPAVTESAAKIPTKTEAKSWKSKLAWSLLFVAIAGVTIWAIVAQADFSLSEFVAFIKSMNPWWILAAFAAMLGFIFFEGWAIITIVNSFGFRKHVGHGMVYSSGDIYFSAITPSATGGQPASAFFMMKDKIPGAIVTLTLIVNLIMYTFAIVIIGVIAFLLNPSIFLGFPLPAKILILIGVVAMIALCVFFLFILFNSSILHKIGNGVLNLLAKLHLIRKLEKKKAKLARAILSYSDAVSQLGGKRLMLLKTLLLNVAQRSSLIAVTLFVFLAAGGAISSAVDVWVSQCMVVIGSNFVPIPGAMGVSDYLLIEAFNALGISNATVLDLISRTISFYSCVILCGVTMVVRIVSYKVIAKRMQRKAMQSNHETNE